MKGIVFNEQQLEARNNRATMFLVPIELPEVAEEMGYTFEDCYDIRMEYSYTKMYFTDDSFSINKPLKIEDEFFIQEEFGISGMMKHLLYKDEYPEDKNLNWIPASQMQEHQARFKDVALDVEVKRVQDITYEEAYKLQGKKQSDFWVDCSNELGMLEDWLEKQGINYDENPYVFLYTVKGK